MPKDRFLITPFNSGWENGKPPFLIMDNAFYSIKNAYTWRDRVRKRWGASLLQPTTPNTTFPQIQSRLRLTFASVAGNAYNSGSNIRLLSTWNDSAFTFAPGQAFSVGDQIYTIYDITGTTVNFLNTSGGTISLDTGTGILIITGADEAAAPIYFYPNLPVMGFNLREQSGINTEKTIAWDIRYSYIWTSTGWERITAAIPAPTAADVWNTGTAINSTTNTNFFWSANYRGSTAAADQTLIFAVNNNLADGIRYLNYGSTAWTAYQPLTASSGGVAIQTAKMVFAFKDRLVLLHTTEGGNTFPQRARYSQNGNPLEGAPNYVAFYQTPTAKYGGYVDNLETAEPIVTAQLLRGRLIVWFGRGVYELVYTGSEVAPFRWQQINPELGAESTFSQVPLDEEVLGVGNVGVIGCNGNIAYRIDEESIPDEVFRIHNNDGGPLRVAGIRDFTQELVYWAYPNQEQSSNQPYPNKILVYNYKNKSWAQFDDSFTAFGYIKKTSGATWGNETRTWGEIEDVWGSGALTPLNKQVIAGNQQGYVVEVQPDNPRNAPALQITNMVNGGSGTWTVTIYNHNLKTGDFILIEDAQGVTDINDEIYPVVKVDQNSITIYSMDGAGTYTGGGWVTTVSKIELVTKQYNFYLKQMHEASISSIQFLIGVTIGGEHTIDYYSSSSSLGDLSYGLDNASLIGTSVVNSYPDDLSPYEAYQSRVWRPVYTWAEGECIQFRLYHTNDQIVDYDIAFSGFELYALSFISEPGAPISL